MNRYDTTEVDEVGGSLLLTASTKATAKVLLLLY